MQSLTTLSNVVTDNLSSATIQLVSMTEHIGTEPEPVTAMWVVKDLPKLQWFNKPNLRWQRFVIVKVHIDSL